MSEKNNIFRRITGSVFTIALFLTAIAACGKERDSLSKPASESIEDTYEHELIIDKELQEEVKAFSLPANMLKMFHEHEEQFDAFAEQCYNNRVMYDSFIVRYIDNDRFYYCLSDLDRRDNITKSTSIKHGDHSYITSFMDYMIDNGLVFRDWMLNIDMRGKINDNGQGEKQDGHYDLRLDITVYEGKQFIISFVYILDSNKDYSEEYCKPGGCVYGGGRKTVRINANWYYEYMVIDIDGYWQPDYKDLAFAEGFYSKRKTTTIMNNFLTENLRGFLRLYWKYGTDFTRVNWWDWEEIRWTEPFRPE